MPTFTNQGPVFGFPGGSGVDIETGGALKCGAYHLAIAYEDDEGQKTNYFELSPAAYISSGDERAIPTTSLTGGTGALPTNKSITWKLKVPDECIYNKVKPAVITINDEVINAFELPSVRINRSYNNKHNIHRTRGSCTHSSRGHSYRRRRLSRSPDNNTAEQ